MSGLQATEEQMARAWKPDETGQGVLRVSSTDSDLAYVPFLTGLYSTSINGSATISQQFAAEGNPYGTLDGVLINVPEGSLGSNSQATITFRFPGRKLALCWDRYRNSNANPVTGFVNGREFSLDNTMRGTQNATEGGSFYQNMVPVPVPITDDGMNECQLVFEGDLTGSTTRQWLLFGYAVEKRLGTPPPTENWLSRPLTLSTTPVSLGFAGAYGYPIRGFEILNNTGVGINITMNRDNIAYPTIAIASGATYVKDFLVPIKLTRVQGNGVGQIVLTSDTAAIPCWLYQRGK